MIKKLNVVFRKVVKGVIMEGLVKIKAKEPEAKDFNVEIQSYEDLQELVILDKKYMVDLLGMSMKIVTMKIEATFTHRLMKMHLDLEIPLDTVLETAFQHHDVFVEIYYRISVIHMYDLLDEVNVITPVQRCG